MRILAITSTPDRPELALLCGLAKAGHAITVLCENPKSIPSKKNLEASELFIKSRFDLSAIKRIKELFTSKQFDIVHSFSARALTSALFATRGGSVRHVAYRGTVGHLSRWDPLSRLSFLSPRVSKISCVSNAVRDYMTSLGVPRARTATIYKGHDVNWYSAPPTETRASLGIPPNTVLGAFLGNMRRVKGADILIDALDKLPDSIHILLIGAVRDSVVAKKLSASGAQKRVHALGFREDGAGLLKLCDFFVMPSREREGFPKAVIEAMAQKVAPIVTNVGGMPEQVEDEISGLIVPANDATALASAIIKLSSDSKLCVRVGEAARARVASSFTVERTVKETLELYNSL